MRLVKLSAVADQMVKHFWPWELKDQVRLGLNPPSLYSLYWNKFKHPVFHFISEQSGNEISSCICQWATGSVYSWLFKWVFLWFLAILHEKITTLSTGSYGPSSAFVSLKWRSDGPVGYQRFWPLTVVRVGASSVTRLFPADDDGHWLGWKNIRRLLTYTAILGSVE